MSKSLGLSSLQGRRNEDEKNRLGGTRRGCDLGVLLVYSYRLAIGRKRVQENSNLPLGVDRVNRTLGVNEMSRNVAMWLMFLMGAIFGFACSQF